MELIDICSNKLGRMMKAIIKGWRWVEMDDDDDDDEVLTPGTVPVP